MCTAVCIVCAAVRHCDCAAICALLCAPLLLGAHMHAVLCGCCRLELVSIKCQLLVLGADGIDSSLQSPPAAATARSGRQR
jgi:hypothetical protein